MTYKFFAGDSLPPERMSPDHLEEGTVSDRYCNSRPNSTEILRDRSYPPQGLQITRRNAIGPSGHYRLTGSGSVTAAKEVTADADPQATTSPSPLVLDLTTMNVVVPRKLGPKSEAEKSASKQLRQAGGACKRHRHGEKKVSSPKIKNPR